MSLKDVSDWSHLLDRSCQIPTDIVFDVIEEVAKEDGTIQVVRSSVECHKLLLAVANPVFRSLFHGPVKMNGKKVVNVQGTTYEAFTSLIKFIYNAPEYLPATADVQKMKDILNIAERYQVKQLAKEVRTVIERFHVEIKRDINQPIKEENVFDDPLRIDNTFSDTVKTEYIDNSLTNTIVIKEEATSKYCASKDFTCDVNSQITSCLEQQEIVKKQKFSTCQENEKSLTRSDDQLILNVDKPYQCQECPKSFSKSRYLQKHQKVHIDQRERTQRGDRGWYLF